MVRPVPSAAAAAILGGGSPRAGGRGGGGRALPALRRACARRFRSRKSTRAYPSPRLMLRSLPSGERKHRLTTRHFNANLIFLLFFFLITLFHSFMWPRDGREGVPGPPRQLRAEERRPGTAGLLGRVTPVEFQESAQ